MFRQICSMPIIFVWKQVLGFCFFALRRVIIKKHVFDTLENQPGYESDVRLELAEAMEDLDEPLVEAGTKFCLK